MIHLEHGQEFNAAGQPTLIVFSPTGDYAPDDLIACARKESPEVSYCAFEAQYIAGLV